MKTDTKINEKFVAELREYIALKSISTDSAFKGEIEKTYRWLEKYMQNAGAKTEIFQAGKSNPVVFGHFLVDEKLPTVLVYGHYDVQPAVKEDGWSTEDPFILNEKAISGKNRFVARGIVDNKGQNFIHVFTVAKLFGEGNLKYNVKFMIEGGEECGSPDVDLVLKENIKKLKADYVLVSDGELVGENPTMESSLRGVQSIKIEYKSANSNQHSGNFGGAIPSAAQELVKLLSSMKDTSNKILIKGFYKNVLIPSKDVLKNNQSLESSAKLLKQIGVKKMITTNKYDFYTQVGCMPNLEITGIKSGYIGEGFSNIVIANAEARINIRTVAKQKTREVVKCVVDYIKKNTPKYIDLKITYEESVGDSIRLDNDCDVAQMIRPILEKSYGKKVVNKYIGGSIPILADFQKILKSKVISVSLGNNDCNMHGVDENFRVDLVEKGLKFAEMFWRK